MSEAFGSDAIQKQLRSLRRSSGCSVTTWASYSITVRPFILSLRQTLSPLGATNSAVSPRKVTSHGPSDSIFQYLLKSFALSPETESAAVREADPNASMAIAVSIFTYVRFMSDVMSVKTELCRLKQKLFPQS